MTSPESPLADATTVAHAVRRRDLSCVAVVEAALARVAARNPPLNAFVAMRANEARAEAVALDARIARGEDPGPLAGVPFGVKDEHDLAGMPTTYGSVPFRDHVVHRDATFVARLRAAGAIPIGKTNLPEFGSTAFTKNHLFGVTRNPWDLTRTPGGSSGGSSAAVAAGMVPFGTGGDGGGSIRIPATYTGLFGIKATFGLLSRAPMPTRDWLDTISQGPLTRSVRDAALILDVAAGYDPLDPDSAVARPGSFLDQLDAVPRGLRIAYSPTLGYATVARDVRDRVESMLDDLRRELGWTIDPIDDRLTDVGMAWALLNSFQTYGRLADTLATHRDDFGRGFAKGLDFGARVTAADVHRCQTERAQLNEDVAAIFARYDVLLTPALPTTAFAAEGPLPMEVDGRGLASPMHAVAFSYPFNMTGHAACVVRAGFGDDGLPVGLQLITERGQDQLLLRLASACERVRPFDRWPEASR
jgi:aspartyl-tRNA(Asn)/glutamyl-tRNA(Gln) amidotransferase subunit A